MPTAESWWCPTGSNFAPVDVALVTEYITQMIKTFADGRTSAVFLGKTPKGTPADLVSGTQRKLAMIDQATQLGDLRAPPSNSLEALKGDRTGQHSIRVNDQWRICFVWQDGDAHDVEFCDYH